MIHKLCPYSQFEVDHIALWEMLILRDTEAFVAQDWNQINDDFIVDGFFGLHAHYSHNPGKWSLAYPKLSDYRDEWLRQAKISAETKYSKSLVEMLMQVSWLQRIEVSDDIATVWKRFEGSLETSNGIEQLRWQTIYFCRKQDNWKITGFLGYLPL